MIVQMRVDWQIEKQKKASGKGNPCLEGIWYGILDACMEGM